MTPLLGLVFFFALSSILNIKISGFTTPISKYMVPIKVLSRKNHLGSPSPQHTAHIPLTFGQRK